MVRGYGARCARFISSEPSLALHASNDLSQASILSSAWFDRRQELVTAGSDGTIRFSQSQKHYRVLLTGRQLIPTLAPRMTISSDFPWMFHMALDEDEQRLFVVNQAEVCTRPSTLHP